MLEKIVKYTSIGSIIFGSGLYLSTNIFRKKKYSTSIEGAFDNIRDVIMINWLKNTGIGLILIGSITYTVNNYKHDIIFKNF